MARAMTGTLLSLDRFFQLIGMNPLHANQVVIPSMPANTCDQPLLQYSWQLADRIGREELAQAIADAEDIFTLHCKFSPAPRWFVEEMHSIDRVYLHENYPNSLAELTHRAMNFRTDNFHLIAGGKETKEFISNENIVYSDEDSDGYFETATITVAVSFTDAQEVAIYYPNLSGDYAYEIRPIKCIISAGIATIVCRREQLAILDLQTSFDPHTIDGLDDANFITSVDIYRHYNDSTNALDFFYESTCITSPNPMSILIRDYKLGIFTPVTYCINLGQRPDKIAVNYYAGFRDNRLTTRNITMAGEFERAVAYLALSMLDRPLCGCRPLNAFISHWKEDLSYSNASAAISSSFTLSSRWLDNPIGTTRGAIHAWRLINRMKIDA